MVMLPLIRLYGGRATKGGADGRSNSGGGGLKVSEGELVAREHESIVLPMRFRIGSAET